MAPPKRDPGAPVEILLRVMGGVAGATSSLAPRLGPLGVSPKMAGQEILRATKDWKGIRLMVKLTVVNRVITCEAKPTTAAYIIKELNEPPREKTKGFVHSGNLKLEQVIKIAKLIRDRSLSKELSGTVLQVLGTCLSVGCTVEGQNPKKVQQMIKSGKIVIEDEPAEEEEEE